jgi:putative restriction endonuclease
MASPSSVGQRLATRAKGIYKPAGIAYALSIRETLNSPYHDREVLRRPDGTWCYPYYQEGDQPDERDRLFTNRALMANSRDGVPVGVMRQVQNRNPARYHVHGLALVTRWWDGYFFLEGFSARGLANSALGETQADVLSQLAQTEIDTDPPEPDRDLDARVRATAQIVRRQGQGRFRQELLAAYRGRCAITGCDATEALEAAHILPYRGKHTDQLSNGLLLRGDLHTLLDLGLLAVEPVQRTVLIARRLRQGTYGSLHGAALAAPVNHSQRPATSVFQRHYDWCAPRLEEPPV